MAGDKKAHSSSGGEASLAGEESDHAGKGHSAAVFNGGTTTAAEAASSETISTLLMSALEGKSVQLIAPIPEGTSPGQSSSDPALPEARFWRIAVSD